MDVLGKQGTRYCHFGRKAVSVACGASAVTDSAVHPRGYVKAAKQTLCCSAAARSE